MVLPIFCFVFPERDGTGKKFKLLFHLTASPRGVPSQYVNFLPSICTRIVLMMYFLLVITLLLFQLSFPLDFWRFSFGPELLLVVLSDVKKERF